MSVLVRDETRPIPDPNHGPLQILSLSGGGYRGLFTACVLERLEAIAERPLRDCFDLIAGTSIGGILACGVAMGVPAKDMREAFQRSGAAVFRRRTRSVFGFTIPALGMIDARYSRNGLETAIRAVLGEDAERKIGEVPKPMVISAIDVTSGRPQLFESGRRAGDYRDTSLLDVCFSTSAAPTYFPEHSIGHRSFVDGGLIANAPDSLAVMKAMTATGRRAEDLSLLSIGTAAAAVGEIHEPGRNSGMFGWMMRRGLFQLTIAAQEQLSVDLVRELLREHVVRIDAKPDQQRARVISLDKTGATASRTLVGLAEEALRDLPSDARIELSAMLRRNAHDSGTMRRS